MPLIIDSCWLYFIPVAEIPETRHLSSPVGGKAPSLCPSTPGPRVRRDTTEWWLFDGVWSSSNAHESLLPRRFSDRFLSTTLAIWPYDTLHKVGILYKGPWDFLRVAVGETDPQKSPRKQGLCLQPRFQEKLREGSQQSY